MNYQYCVEKAREVIANAYLTTEGKDYKQRQAFSMLMPQVSQLRSKGFSFHEIASLLKEGGFKLSPCTVREYFTELNVLYMQELILEVDEQIHLRMSRNLNNNNSTTDLQKEIPVEKRTDQAGIQCLPLQSGITSLDKRLGVPDEVYCEGLLEHPAIPGLWLTKEERLYRSALEIVDANGDKRFETAHERRFRIKWQKPIPRTPSSSEKDFVTMDMSLFAKQREP